MIKVEQPLIIDCPRFRNGHSVNNQMSSIVPSTTRRNFIALSTMGILGIIADRTLADTTSFHTNKYMNTESHIGYVDGKYVLPPLPYAYDALEPLMDKETVMYHHDKHHAAYVKGANDAAEKLRQIADGTLDPSNTTAVVRNLAFHTSGHVLHTMYWTNMSPNPKEKPEGKLLSAINEKFGSFDSMVKVFKAATIGVEGSGWGILGIDPFSKKLVICGAEKHQNLEIPGLVPILACDVWEHAFYLKHKNDKASFVESFMKLINWADVEARYEAGIA